MAGFLVGMDVEKLEIAVENGKKAFEVKQYVILVFLVSERANELYPLFLVYSIHKVTFGFRTDISVSSVRACERIIPSILSIQYTQSDLWFQDWFKSIRNVPIWECTSLQIQQSCWLLVVGERRAKRSIRRE